ncbi:MAG TPA: adenosylcobinamide-GDP ribazoletransferase [Anaeromyxobacteraceae bacterium]|nr:adenosylcobinamide-GDP ribazoletransferase [Anaeromyxobacteraceae bacterium]
MRRLAVALAFLTRLPMPGPTPADAAEVGRAVVFFPVAGAVLGAILAASARLLSPRFPPTLCAALLVALLALLTGALHLDGLADMADGFGGGTTREDVLRIMRDHSIGTYGASAIVLTLALKAAAIAALLAAGTACRWLILAPALARWVPVALGTFLAYARHGGGLGTTVTDHRGLGEFVGATALAVLLSVCAARLRGLIAFGAVAAWGLAHGVACKRRIGGVTGDTLGAATETAEVVALLVAVALA